MFFCEKRFKWNVVNVNVLYYNKNFNNFELIEIVFINKLSTFSYFIKYNSIWSILRLY